MYSLFYQERTVRNPFACRRERNLISQDIYGHAWSDNTKADGYECG